MTSDTPAGVRAPEAVPAAADRRALARFLCKKIWTEGEWSPLAERHYAEDLTLHVTTVPGPPRHGRDALKAIHHALRTAYPDLHMEAEDVAVDRETDTVVLRLAVAGTQRGEYFGFPATGKPMKVTEIVVWRFEKDRIQEVWLVPDVSGQLKQLGHIPSGPPPRAVVFLMKLIARLKGQ